jgi:outer membrane immunogenic protein
MRDKHLAGALLGALLLSAGSAASAADLPSRKTAPVTYLPPAFSWTGFYVGANAGYAFQAEGDATTVGTTGFLGLVPAGIAPGRLKVGGDGFIGGAQVGYNWQLNQFVLGVEADIQGLDNKRQSTFIGNPVLGTQLATTASSELSYLGTVRARIGFVPLERWLVYATAGLAYGEVKSSAGVSGVQAPVLNWAGNRSDVQVGYTVGGGVEYALANNWTVKAEYLYYDLGKETIRTIPNAAAAATVPGVAYDARVETKGQIVRAGINYKF